MKSRLGFVASCEDQVRKTYSSLQAYLLAYRFFYNYNYSNFVQPYS